MILLKAPKKIFSLFPTTKNIKANKRGSNITKITNTINIIRRAGTTDVNNR